MTYFEIINEALDALLPDLVQVHGGDQSVAFKAVNQALNDMTSEWCQDQNVDMNYSDPTRQFAYLYKQTGVNAAMLASMLSRRANTYSWFQGMLTQHRIIDVCSLGAGPGSDMIGLTELALSYLEKNVPADTVKLNVAMVDIVGEWLKLAKRNKEILNRKIGEANQDAELLPLVVQGQYGEYDFVNEKDLFQKFNGRRYHLFTMVYAFSEFKKNPEAIGHLLDTTYDSAHDGARFILIERNEPGVIETIGEAFANSKWEAGKPLTDGEHKVETMRHKPNAMQSYIDAISEHHSTTQMPRLKWKAVCFTARKP